MKNYSECEKLSLVRDGVDNLVEFLEFLNKKGVQFGEFSNCVNNTPWLQPIKLERNGETLAAEFLGIDMTKVEKEREEIFNTLVGR